MEGKYYWMEEELPSGEISLRSARTENFVIIDITNPAHHRVVGEMDRFTVPMLLHENAIYMHDARMFQVEKLDLAACKAYIRAVDVDYYTDADLNVSLHILDDLEHKPLPCGGDVALGELRVSTIVKMFKKFKLDTHESVGFARCACPRPTCTPSACGGPCPTASSGAMATTRCRARWWASPTFCPSSRRCT